MFLFACPDHHHFQIAFLNRTVGYLKEEMKSPQSAVKITQDIESLKKGMADISQEITQVKDQVAQLKKLAVSQNSDLADMRDNIWNLTVSVQFIWHHRHRHHLIITTILTFTLLTHLFTPLPLIIVPSASSSSSSSSSWVMYII